MKERSDLEIYALFASFTLALVIFFAGVVYRMGHISARVEELERWRANMRQDMHEVSEKIEEIKTKTIP